MSESDTPTPAPSVYEAEMRSALPPETPTPPPELARRPIVYCSYPYLTYDHCPDYMASLRRTCGTLAFFDPGDRSDPNLWPQLLLYFRQHSLTPALLPDALFRSLDLPLALLAPPGQEQLAWGTQLNHRGQLLRTLYVLLRSQAVLADGMLPSRAENCVELVLAKACDLPILVVSDLPGLTPALGYLANAVAAPTEKLLPDLLSFYVGYTTPPPAPTT
jgi:hypothetical protein